MRGGDSILFLSGWSVYAGILCICGYAYSATLFPPEGQNHDLVLEILVSGRSPRSDSRLYKRQAALPLSGNEESAACELQ